jgi:hypothetical protein
MMPTFPSPPKILQGGFSPLRSGKLDRPVQYRFFRRSNFLALRDRQG